MVQHTDRLARGDGRKGGARHLGGLFFDCRELGIRLRSVQDDANLEDAIRAVLIGERNFEDSKRESAATRDGLRRHKVERGAPVGAIPLGYVPVRLRREDEYKTRIVDETEAATVADIRAEALEPEPEIGVNEPHVRVTVSAQVGDGPVPQTTMAVPASGPHPGPGWFLARNVGGADGWASGSIPNDPATNLPPTPTLSSRCRRSSCQPSRSPCGHLSWPADRPQRLSEAQHRPRSWHVEAAAGSLRGR